MKKLTKIIGAGILELGLVGGCYLAGSYKGFQNGREFEKKELIITLDMERYDSHQNAKFAGSIERQNEILEEAGVITRTFETLDRVGYFNDIKDKQYQDVIK